MLHVPAFQLQHPSLDIFSSCIFPLPEIPRNSRSPAYQAGISHFLDVVTKGSKPQLAAADCLAAAAVMAAAEQSLRTGTPVAVSRDWAAFAAGPAGATATVTLAASAAAACKLSDAASALVLGSCQPVQGSRKVSGAFTPPERPAN